MRKRVFLNATTSAFIVFLVISILPNTLQSLPVESSPSAKAQPKLGDSGDLVCDLSFKFLNITPVDMGSFDGYNATVDTNVEIVVTVDRRGPPLLPVQANQVILQVNVSDTTVYSSPVPELSQQIPNVTVTLSGVYSVRAGYNITAWIDATEIVNDSWRINNILWIVLRDPNGYPEHIDTPNGRIAATGKQYGSFTRDWPLVLLCLPSFEKAHMRPEATVRSKYQTVLVTMEQTSETASTTAGIAIESEYGFEIGGLGAKAAFGSSVESTWGLETSDETRKTYGQSYTYNPPASAAIEDLVICEETQYQVYEYIGESGELAGPPPKKVWIGIVSPNGPVVVCRTQSQYGEARCQNAPPVPFTHSVGDKSTYPQSPEYYRVSPLEGYIFWPEQIMFDYGDYNPNGVLVTNNSYLDHDYSISLETGGYITESYSVSTTNYPKGTISGPGVSLSVQASFGSIDGYSHTLYVGEELDFEGSTGGVTAEIFMYKWFPYIYVRRIFAVGMDALGYYLVLDHYWEPYSSGAVGGVWVPVDKLSLLAPYIALASTILVATAIYVKRVKRKKEKQ